MSTTSTQQQTLTYAIDPVHSTIEFVARHLMITKVRGNFNQFEGTIQVAPGDNLPKAANLKIEGASIDTRNEQRDGHLKSADFLEVEKFPEITFTSTTVAGAPDDFRLHGNLTIHGVTREVVLQGEFEGGGADPWGGQRVGYSAKTKINRKDFGLVWNQALETGGVAVGEEVTIELNIQAVLQAPA